MNIPPHNPSQMQCFTRPTRSYSNLWNAELAFMIARSLPTKTWAERVHDCLRITRETVDKDRNE